MATNCSNLATKCGNQAYFFQVQRATILNFNQFELIQIIVIPINDLLSIVSIYRIVDYYRGCKVAQHKEVIMRYGEVLHFYTDNHQILYYRHISGEKTLTQKLMTFSL